MTNIKTIGAYGNKGHYHYFRLIVEETTINNENNTSTIKYTFNLSEKSGYYFDWNSWGSAISYTININGNKITGTIPEFTPSTSGTNLKTGTLTIPHDNDGTKTIPISFNVTDKSGASYTCGNASSSDYMNLTVIPRASVLQPINDFIVENPILVNITKYVESYKHKLEIYNSDKTTIIKTITGVENGDSFSFTSEELNTIYSFSSQTNSYKLIFVLNTYTDDTYETQVTGSSEVSTNALITNASPVFTGFDYEENNQQILALTNSLNYVKGYSDIKISNLVANGQKNATITGWIVNNNVIENTGNNIIIINKVETDVVTVYALDSRGNTTPHTVQLSGFINYNALTKGAQSYDRIDDITEKVSIGFEGDYTPCNFGVIENSLKSVSYKYKITSSDQWVNGETVINPTIQGNKYSFNGLIKGDTNEGFDIENSYDIEVIVTDELSTVIYSYLIQSGKPAIAIYGNKLSLGNKFDENLSDYSLQLWGNISHDGKPFSQITALDVYPVGSIYMSTNNVDPGTIFGGTWEQIKDKFLLASGDTYSLGDIGGEATHTLTVNEMPSHNHRQTVTAARSGSGTTYVSWNANNLFGNTDTAARNTLNTGGGKAHNNMPPYLVVSVWQRIS